jgi:hypothetical protein
LVVKNREGVLVVDINISQEDGDYLQMGRSSKIEKYAQLQPDVQQSFNSEIWEVLSIVIGKRRVFSGVISTL